MKEKQALLIMDGYMVCLTSLMLILTTWWIGHHLFAGNFNLIGGFVAAIFWTITAGLFRLSVKDYQKTKISKETEE